MSSLVVFPWTGVKGRKAVGTRTGSKQEIHRAGLDEKREVPLHWYCIDILRKVKERNLDTDRNSMEWVSLYQFCSPCHLSHQTGVYLSVRWSDGNRMVNPSGLPLRRIPLWRRTTVRPGPRDWWRWYTTNKIKTVAKGRILHVETRLRSGSKVVDSCWDTGLDKGSWIYRLHCRNI